MVRAGLGEAVAMGFLCRQAFEGDRANPEGISSPGSRPTVRWYIPKFHLAVYPPRGKIDGQPLGLSPLGIGISSNHIGGSYTNKLIFIGPESWF